VPGLAKQTSTPDDTAVLTSSSAPFTIDLHLLQRNNKTCYSSR
jgi:hypothetical protein